jgi:environmental stress-induced protein Ves
MKLTHLTAAGYVRQDWKNGGGTTTEIARDADRERWWWRLSIADVQRSGPFSDFTGYRRIITLLEGRGIALTFDRAPPVVLDRVYRAIAFDGGWRTECRLLDGPVRDMNLIIDDTQVAATFEVRTLEEGASLEFAACESTLLHALRGRFQARHAGQRIALRAGETLRIDDAAAARVMTTALEPHAVLAVIGITRRC